jgi:ATP-binding cassette subfamily F protein 3
VAYLPQEVETVPSGSVLSVALSGYAEIAELERRMERLEERLAALDSVDPAADRLTVEYGELRHCFEALGGDLHEARAKTILSGLGLPSESFHRSLETLSGGWRMRVALARLLVGRPGLLLLDEPTNHLDLEAVGWLEQFLESYEGAFVVVSHDRYFLNRMVREIVELEHGRLERFPGSYDEYVVEKQARTERLEKEAHHQAREIARTERFIERFRYKNTKARQVQSRIRALSKVERIELPRQSARIRFGFPPAPRSGAIVVRAEALTKRFGDTVVYDGMELLLRRGARVALVGPNGAGKSTLLKLLARRLRPDEGQLTVGHNVEVHYYAQHQLDDLDPTATVLEEVERVAGAGEVPSLRGLLGRFLFTGAEVDKRVAVLSGGEKARLALLKMLVHPANLLLLDEPTNHLDLRSREVLEEALDEYAGSLVVISHDRYFINRVATSIGEVGGGRIELYDGDYDEHLAHVAARIGEQPAAPAAPAARGRRREAKRREAERRNLEYRRRRRVEKRLAPLERGIAELEQRIGTLRERQADPEVYSRPDRARDVARDLAAAERRLELLYTEWETEVEAE